MEGGEVTDTAKASIVTSHAFVPKGEWWNLCEHCNLGEAAHRETTSRPRVREDVPTSNDVPALPQWSGSICLTCGGQMIRTGSCEICSSCGSNTGCG